MNRLPKVILISLAIGLIAIIAISLVSITLIHPPSALLDKRASSGSYTSVINGSTRLRLILSTNSTGVAVGGGIAIQISEQNTLLLPNNITSAHNYPITGLAIGPCGVLNGPTGFAIFRGNHTQNDLPNADRLALYAPAIIYNCPAIYSITSYTFAPGNSCASINGSSLPNPCFIDSILSGGAFNGYWTGVCTDLYQPCGTFHAFLSGVYTVVGGDEWGSILVLHFTVS